MKGPFVILGALVAYLAAGPASAQSAKVAAPPGASSLKAMMDQQGGAIFRGLDKITARVSTIYAPLDVPVRYGSLSLTVRKCNARPPEEPPEKAAFIEIDEEKPGKDPVHQFTGWMFWSSPALNGLQHPVYDLWLLDCQRSAAERSAEAAAAAAAPAATATTPEEGVVDIEPEEAPPALPDTAVMPGESEGDDAPLNLPPDVPQ
jgi:hypothetical protein